MAVDAWGLGCRRMKPEMVGPGCAREPEERWERFDQREEFGRGEDSSQNLIVIIFFYLFLLGSNGF